MKPNYPPRNDHFESNFRLTWVNVLEEDIVNMNYYLNECPMAQPSSKNAISFALKRVLQPTVGRTLVREIGGKGYLVIGDRRYGLGRSLGEWLSASMRGYGMKPVVSLISLPEELIRKQLLVANRASVLPAQYLITRPHAA